MKRSIILLSLVIIVLNSNPAQWSQAQLDTLLCQSTDNTLSFKRGELIVICLQVIPINKKISFTLKVDDYTALKMSGLYDYTLLQTSSDKLTYLMAQAHYGLKATSPVLYYKQSGLQYQNKEVYPIYSLIVTLNQGIVEKVEWDNGCWGCAGQTACISIQDYLKTETSYYQNCKVSPVCQQGKSSECDPQVYVSFMGTDKEGSYMNSASERFSRFQSYSIADMYQSALKIQF